MSIKGHGLGAKETNMDFILLFSLIGSLSFDLQFEIQKMDQQDFFFFEGANTTAHLFRKNSTILLYLRKEGEYNTYQTEIIDELDFSWDGFKVNGSAMTLVMNNTITNINFDTFTFLSPILNFDTREEPVIMPISEKINYGYIMGVVFIVALLFESRPRIISLILKTFQHYRTNYEVMKIGVETPSDNHINTRETEV